MVIVNSDSNNTLVSLGNNSDKLVRVKSLDLILKQQLESLPKLEPTFLWLPENAEDNDLTDNSLSEPKDYWYESSSDDCSISVLKREPLYLPEQTTSSSTKDMFHVDECLSYLPCIVESCEALLAQPIQVLDSDSSELVIYVGQGEVGHAVPMQADLICSDRATTCHIVAFYSTSNNSVPLATCVHLDEPNYRDCLHQIFLKHESHHFCADDNSNDDEIISLDIHVVGGFDDDHGTSKRLSDWLFYNLADLAKEFSGRLRCTLRTALISGLNTHRCSMSGQTLPAARGLALSLQTGQVALVQVDRSMAGPDYVVRQARLWSNDDRSSHGLTTVHTQHSTHYQVHPFSLDPKCFGFSLSDLHLLSRLDDAMLLHYTSTSPHAEDGRDFCKILRETLQFLKLHLGAPPRALFPNETDPRRYERVSGTNQWRPVKF